MFSFKNKNKNFEFITRSQHFIKLKNKMRKKRQAKTDQAVKRILERGELDDKSSEESSEEIGSEQEVSSDDDEFDEEHEENGPEQEDTSDEESSEEIESEQMMMTLKVEEGKEAMLSNRRQPEKLKRRSDQVEPAKLHHGFASKILMS